MSWLFPRGTRRLPPVWVDDVPNSVKVEMFDMLMKDMLKRPLRYINVGGYDMHNDKEELMKELIKKRANEEIEEEASRLIDDGIPKELIKPLWEDEMLKEQIENTTDEVRETFRRSWDEIMEEMHVKNSPERKRKLMRLEKELLVDMVFNLESRNEMLVNNLSEVEKMYNKLKNRVDELETEVFSLRNQNELWQCVAEGYKKEKEEK